MKSRNRLPELYQAILPDLAAPRRIGKIVSVIEQFAASRNLAASTASRLKSKLLETGVHAIPFKWPSSSAAFELFTSLPVDDLSPLQIAMGFFDNGYLCYQTALYWNELSEQVPQTFYVARERPAGSLSSQAPDQWDDLELRDAFTKLPHEHKRVAVFKGSRFILLDRAHTHREGVISKELKQKGRIVPVMITGVERTLLDCAAVPENAGGVSNVVDAFTASQGRVDFIKLLQTYNALDLKYPHWQRIGLLLEKTGQVDHARTWTKKFGKPKNKFYLGKGYKLGWQFDDKWQIYFPKGLFG